jgi:hypothetical protein
MSYIDQIRQQTQEAITALGDERAGLAARREQITKQIAEHEHQISQLRSESTLMLVRSEESMTEQRELERLLAQMQEHAPQEATTEPDDGPTIEVPTHGPAPAKPHVMPGTRRKPRPDRVKAAKKAEKAAAAAKAKAANTGGRYSKDPLHVNSRVELTVPMGRGKGVKRPRADVENNIDPASITPTDQARADLLHEWLKEQGKPQSQHQMGIAMADLLEAKIQTARSIVSRSIRVLQHQRLIVYAGYKVESTTPDHLASAGLGVHEDDFAGRTSGLKNEPYKPPARGSFESAS